MGCSSSSQKSLQSSDSGANWPAPRAKEKTTFKIVFLGKSGVGKTSITLRYCRNTFQDGTEATIGASFLTKSANIGDKNIKFELWDTAGQDRYRALAPMYYRNADAAVLVYDITDPESFSSLQTWYQELQKNVSDCIIFLCGNKIDLSGDRKVTVESAQEYAEEKECPLIEVSSKTGEGVEALFEKLGQMLIDKSQ